MDFRLSRLLCTLAMAGASLASAQAEEKVLNLYSARHYQTDEALYSGFTRQTGITIKRIEGKRTSCSSGSGTRVPTARRMSC
jgi:iron(III) transport system substrate-binding protein